MGGGDDGGVMTAGGGGGGMTAESLSLSFALSYATEDILENI